MREYTRVVIEKEWPAHKRGIALEDGDTILDRFENEVMSFEPAKEREDRACRGVAVVGRRTEQRRLRLQAVSTGLPAALWCVVLIGALINGILTYLFWLENLKLHVILVAAILATFIAVLIFLTAAMDNPFRGHSACRPTHFRPSSTR